MFRVTIDDLTWLDRSPLAVSSAGVEGWWSTPPRRSQPTEKVWDHGAWASRGNFHSPRLVVINSVSMYKTPDEHYRLWEALNGLAGEPRKLTIENTVDKSRSAFAYGYVETDMPATRAREVNEFRVLVTCHDPLKYAVNAETAKLTQQQSVTFFNRGNVPVYPIFTVRASQSVEGGFRINTSDGQEPFRWQGEFNQVAPVMVDGKKKLVTRGGLNETYRVTQRGWPYVPPNRKRTFTFTPASAVANDKVWVDVSFRPAWL